MAIFIYFSQRNWLEYKFDWKNLDVVTIDFIMIMMMDLKLFKVVLKCWFKMILFWMHSIFTINEKIHKPLTSDVLKLKIKYILTTTVENVILNDY